MYFLIQKNVFADPRYDEIFRVVKQLNLPHETVEFLSNSNDLIYKTNRKDIFVYGSVKLAKITKEFDWQPGSFYGKNHEFEKYSIGFGEHLINSKSRLFQFLDNFDWEEAPKLFIKPSRDAKIFTGKVFSKVEWEDFVYYTLRDKKQTKITTQSNIQVSAAHKIIKEARLWIVDDKIVTSSYYLFHDGTEFEENVSEAALVFGQQMANLFRVADAYVLDIALTYDSWKVVEVNCINSAGFYKANVENIILALEQFYLKE
jgi:hypothetical protein